MRVKYVGVRKFDRKNLDRSGNQIPNRQSLDRLGDRTLNIRSLGRLVTIYQMEEVLVSLRGLDTRKRKLKWVRKIKCLSGGSSD